MTDTANELAQADAATNLATELERLSAAATPVLSAEIIPDLNNIVRAIEDEGDRAYLGSTNDADRLREIANWLDRHLRDFPFPAIIAALKAAETQPTDDVAGLVKRLRKRKLCKDGVMRQPEKVKREAADALTAQARQIAERDAALRWIFINGLKKQRPDFVDKALSDAMAPVRRALEGDARD